MVLTTLRPAGGSFRVSEHSNQNDVKQTSTRKNQLRTHTWSNTKTGRTPDYPDNKVRVTTESTPKATDSMEVELPPSAATLEVTEEVQRKDIEGCSRRPLDLKTEQPAEQQGIIIGNVNPKVVSKDCGE